MMFRVTFLVRGRSAGSSEGMSVRADTARLLARPDAREGRSPSRGCLNMDGSRGRKRMALLGAALRIRESPHRSRINNNLDLVVRRGPRCVAPVAARVRRPPCADPPEMGWAAWQHRGLLVDTLSAAGVFQVDADRSPRSAFPL